MINSYKEITRKYLRANKKRTILTLIGIILSISLISAIGFFLKSMQETQIQDMKNTYGSWHMMYKNANEQLMTKVKNNPIVFRSGTYSTGQLKNLNEKLKVKEIYGSDDAFKMLPYKLKEGRLPSSNKEVALEKWFLDKISDNAKIGDQVKVLNKEYTLVGVLSNTTVNQYKGIGELITMDSDSNSKERALLVEFEVNRHLKQHIDELKTLSNQESITENELLIIAQGQGVPRGMIVVMTVIIGIVVLSTIAVIYNAFQISVVERVKQFGLLRAVGATPKQIRKVILREATILALIGIPIGLFFGVVAIYGIDVAFKIIGGENMAFKTTTITSDVIIISVIIGLLSIYISAFLPAFFAGRVSPLVAISSRNSITKEKVKRRKSMTLGRLFGFEGALATKNIRRNRKRYRITVFSIIISVTLFISFKSFIDMSLNVYTSDNESDKIHFSVVTESNSENQAWLHEKVISEINNLPSTETSYRVYRPYYFDAVIDKSKEVKEIKQIGSVYKNINYKGENKTLMGASLVVYDNKALDAAKSYLNNGVIDENRLNEENGVIIISKNRVFNEKTERTFYGSVTDLKVGDEIELQQEEFRYEGKEKFEFGQGTVNKVKVLGIFESDPFTFSGDQRQIKMVTTVDVAKKLILQNIKPVGLNIEIKDVNQENIAKKNIENIIKMDNNLKLINIIDRNRTSKAAILMVKILLYGFVIVVSLISSVNIINTLTTNIILRRREFAALKSIGLTQKGLRKMITLEGVLYGMMGTVYGTVFGIILSYILFKGINDVREQSYQIPFNAIGIAAIGAILIGYLSVLAPLRRMKKDNLIDAVREDI